MHAHHFKWIDGQMAPDGSYLQKNPFDKKQSNFARDLSSNHWKSTYLVMGEISGYDEVTF